MIGIEKGRTKSLRHSRACRKQDQGLGGLALASFRFLVQIVPAISGAGLRPSCQEGGRRREEGGIKGGGGVKQERGGSTEGFQRGDDF